MLLLSWEGAAAAGASAAGGKGWNLGRLHRYGFAVPSGGVISSEACRQFLALPLLREAAAPLLQVHAEDVMAAEALAASERMQAAIMAAPLPEETALAIGDLLDQQGLNGQPVAVRSSAVAEDSPDASFAGIHQSFLNVIGRAEIIRAVKGCYASLWTPRALAYRRRLGLSEEAVAVAVVIMGMVPAKAAGVCFTCDPRTGRRDRCAISAAHGLGEAVVSGATEPDEYLLGMDHYPPPLESRRVGRKIRMTALLAGGGTDLVDLSAADAARPALTDDQLQELALLAARVQDALGEGDRPQDIEWAHDGKKFWLLQARPVTTIPAPAFAPVADQPVIWSNANLRDVLPGVASELGWSFMRSGMDVLLSAPFKASGYEYGGGMTWVRLFQGRAYFNLSAMQWAYYDAFGMEPAEVNRVIGGHQPEIALPAVNRAQRLKRDLRRLRLVGATLRSLQTAPAAFRRNWQWADKAEAAPFGQWGKPEFMAASLEMKRIMEAYMPHFQLINGGAGGIHQELIKLLTPLFGDRSAGLVNAMLAGATGITSAEQGERLVELGNTALREERVRAWFSRPDWRPADWARALAGSAFAAGFTAYLRDYGHRGVYEVEPMNPRWREEPAYLLETVRSQVLGGREIRLEGAAAKREAARREVFGRIGWSPRGLRARFYLRQAALAAAHREMGKSVLVKLMGVTRITALALGRRMAAEGVLEQPTDIFHLSWPDMEAYLTDRSGTGGFRALVADRKALRQRHLLLEPPDIILGDTPVKKAPVVAGAGGILRGTGVAAGRAAGTARVVRHPEEGGRLGYGEVLVAPSTDPAWTPLFLRASAVVMEVGGYLSHGAIVAREYGLPAVANIPGLLTAVADGESLTVDGDEGSVYRMP